MGVYARLLASLTKGYASGFTAREFFLRKAFVGAGECLYRRPSPLWWEAASGAIYWVETTGPALGLVPGAAFKAHDTFGKPFCESQWWATLNRLILSPAQHALASLVSVYSSLLPNSAPSFHQHRSASQAFVVITPSTRFRVFCIGLLFPASHLRTVVGSTPRFSGKLSLR